MPTNVTPHYEKAEQEYHLAKTNEQKIKALKKMLSLGPTHKGGEKLRSNIKKRIAKLKYVQEKEKQIKKSGKGFSIKKEGAARIVLVGMTNSGKSTLLSKITNAKPLIANYKFTTTKPEIGTMDYCGILLQVIEIPAITENFFEKHHPYVGVIRESDLIVILHRDKRELKFIEKELEDIGITKIKLKSSEDGIRKIWKALKLIYVYTKSPGRERDYPPVALGKNFSVKDLTLKVHKDFFKNFNYARIWGKSAKHPAMRVGLDHVLKERDVIEIHLK
jgi:uncharacterized protein